LISSISIRRHADAAAFLSRAEAWLLGAEAENNLILGIARRLVQAPASFDAQVYLASVEDAGQVVGCAFRTPPFKLGLTEMPPAALPLLVEDVADVYTSLPAVLGPNLLATEFASLWSQRTGRPGRAGMLHRIYQLERVIRPPAPPPGSLRVAEPRDAAIITSWLETFRVEAGVAMNVPRTLCSELIEKRSLFLWDDDGPCCMAGWNAASPNGVRIGYVFTPRERRGRGYASVCTADVSQRALDAGRRYCFLYTDLANPTSNAIYGRIGYRPVADVMDWLLE
jgi:hypothetical protein